MKLINHSIIGSGLSALIKDQISKNTTIFYSSEKKIKKSKRFYEFDSLGGNTNIWGGYINYKRYTYLLRERKFRNFFNSTKLFKIKKFIVSKSLNQTYYLSQNNNDNIFRIKKKHFKNKMYNNKIQKLVIKKNFIVLQSKKKFKTRYLSCCLGNLSLIELLFNSKLIKGNDKLSFKDGSCNYTFNIFKNKKKNYYIPMTLKEIFKKLIFGITVNYERNIISTLILQKFSNKNKFYEYTVDDILSFKSKYFRFFLSNHLVNISINKLPIDKFIKKISSRIKIYNSGVCKNYSPGPISQDIIYNVLKK